MIGNNKKLEVMEDELINYCPKRNKLNFPAVNYSLRLKDLIPALSGIIGKTALVAAFAMAWMKGLGITNPSFVTENVRLEIIIGSIACILFTSFLNPYAAPPGTLAPLIPLVPLMASLGVHPLIHGLFIGVLGLILSSMNYFNKIAELNGTAARAGVTLLFGIMGILSSVDSITKWATAKSNTMHILLIASGVFVYLLLTRIKCKWLMIPAAAVIGFIVPAMYGVLPQINTAPALPIINPRTWWVDLWGIGWGIEGINFVKALPFALLAVMMWPTDAVALRVIQESNYGPKAKRSLFEMNSTFAFVSIRNIIGCLFGGAQTSAIWRSFMIPLSIVRRPIGGSSFFLGVFGIAFALLGFPIDIAVYPPILGLVLLFGIFLPLTEVGLSTLKTPAQVQIASLCVIAGLSINPVIGWAIALAAENLNIIKDQENSVKMNREKIIMTIVVSVVTSISYMISVIL